MMGQDRAELLFGWRNPYDHKGTSGLFLELMRESLAFHGGNCEAYGALLKAEGVWPDQLRTEADLAKIPVVPTVYFKRRAMLSVSRKELRITAVSSGTSGMRSFVGFDQITCNRGQKMLPRYFWRQGLISLIPVNYLVLGVRPDGSAAAGAFKTLQGATKLAPAVRVEYMKALRDKRAVKVLEQYVAQGLPVRLLGFPAFLDGLLTVLEEHGTQIRLPKGSKILMGGGFKQHAGGRRSDQDLRERCRRYLGIGNAQIHEFFSLVEHPIPYCKCREGFFHVPVYSRVMIRDSVTLEPLPEGVPGLLNLVSPMVRSMPLLSVVTDDFAVWHQGGICKCGNPAPYFQWLGRAGVDDIRTCAAKAASQGGGSL